MIRKIIKQGKGAYTITLPKKWVEENQLNENGEINIEEKENSLIIQNLKEPIINIKKIKLNLEKGLKENYRSLIASLYRTGYDEIHLELEETLQIAELEKTINSIFGLELFIIDKKNCLIKSIYDNEKTQVKLHVTRIIFSIETMQKIIMDDIKEKKLDSYSEIQEIRNNILKQRDLILRIIKKQKLFDDDNFPYLTITLSLWGVARNYYHMYSTLSKEDFNQIEILEKTNSFFQETFSKLFKKELKNTKEFYQNYIDLLNEVKINLIKNKINPFCFTILTETQLSYASIYILKLK
jgi:phosphate uptake regulator